MGRDGKSLSYILEESPLLRFSEVELHTRLVRYESTEYIYDPEADRPTLEIIADRKVLINGIALALSEARVFALNVLRLSQGEPITVDEMLRLGFSGQQSLGVNLRAMARTIHELSGDVPLIAQSTNEQDQALAYMLLPEVQIIDRRDEIEPPALPRQLSVHNGVVFDSDGEIDMLENGSIHFTAPRKRAAITLAMMNDFGPWAQADRTLLQLFEGRIGSRTTDVQILPLDYFQSLTRVEEQILLAEKERGLLEYIKLGSFPTANQLEIIVEGIDACYELFARNLDLVGILAYNHGRTSYEDFYQEGAAQLMDTILRQGVGLVGHHNFRAIVERNIRHENGRGMSSLYYDALLPPGTFPYSSLQGLHDFKRTIGNMEQEGTVIPSATELSQQLSMGRDRVLGFMSMGMEMIYLDADGEMLAEAMPEAESAIDAALSRIAYQESADMLLCSDALSDPEKAILSLHYQVFHKALCGMELYIDERLAFTYPLTQEAFTAFTDRNYTLTTLSTEVLGTHHEYVRRIHDQALRKARQLLLECPDFDTTGRADAEEEEKQDIIASALVVSPSKRLGAREIRNAYRTGDLLANEGRICRLFGSVPAFQEACGFEPDRGQANRNMTDEAIIALAKTLQPDRPLTARQIRQFSKDKSFVSLQAILDRWDTLPAFKKACGFEV
jgi:hypothetical protein